ncbi:MAG: AraC family transcriptional regulator [Actinobacteria bacterium]|nr:MAG: AraC family transcriptional regulator [Actinomycetota bacterium]
MPLAVNTVDAHCHLDIFTEGGPGGAGVRAVLDRAKAVGIDRIVQVGCDVESSRYSVECANAFPGEVVAAIALHPNDAPRLPDLEAALSEIEKLAENPRVRAIGETGLDHFRTPPEKRDVQEYSFRRHIALAKKLGKTLMIHDRDAHEDVLRVLEEEGAPEQVVFHCFSGDAVMAQVCAARGYVLSFAGTLTFKNSPQLREALALIPADQFLVETDAPFLTPMPYRGRPNAPYLIPHTVRLMAEIRGVGEEEIARVTSATAERLFGPF